MLDRGVVTVRPKQPTSTGRPRRTTQGSRPIRLKKLPNFATATLHFRSLRGGSELN